ncbi:MAG: hypothetical protein PHV30_03150 [Candidatus Margulisbacteria bacterium]|nr:hypothetical protein [Candidatus Margulisiibacteriota bacterium]
MSYQQKVTKFQVIDNGPCAPYYNMQKDLEMFSEVETEPAMAYLRFYTWTEHCISYGCNQQIKIVEDYKEKQGLPSNIVCVRRPTGGGIVYHKPGDFTFCLVFPLSFFPRQKSLLEIYYKISEILNMTLNQTGIDSCLAKQSLAEYKEKKINDVCLDFPAKYEILLDNRKILGSAQKKGKKALLQQTNFFTEIIKKKEFSRLLANNLQDCFK